MDVAVVKVPYASLVLSVPLGNDAESVSRLR
jgi:hypothetical protein